jgi:hypothetical protein
LFSFLNESAIVRRVDRKDTDRDTITEMTRKTSGTRDIPNKYISIIITLNTARDIAIKLRYLIDFISKEKKKIIGQNNGNGGDYSPPFLNSLRPMCNSPIDTLLVSIIPSIPVCLTKASRASEYTLSFSGSSTWIGPS